MERLLLNGYVRKCIPHCARGIPVGTDVGPSARYSAMTAAGCTEAGDPRGQQRRAGADGQGTVAFRGNFATVTEDMAVVDRRAGRISQVQEFLALAVNGMVLSDRTQVLAKN